MCEFQFYLNTHITVKQPLLLVMSKRDVRVTVGLCGFMDSEKVVVEREQLRSS